MNTYKKIKKSENFKKINFLNSGNNKITKEESALSAEESEILENHYNNITANLTDYETLISFDVYNIENLSGIINYRDKNNNHKQLRY